MANEFTIEEIARPSVTLFRVAGRLDAKNSQTLTDRCHAVEAAGVKHVVLNLAGISFAASSGIGALLALTEHFSERGGTLRVAAPSNAVRSIVDLLNLGQFLRIDVTEEAGLAAAAVAGQQ